MNKEKIEKKSKNNDPPYLKENRLAEVIAALQAMGVYRHYKLSFAEWSVRIYGNEDRAGDLKKLFIEHPEFFRLSGKEKDKASLVWRRNLVKTYDPKKHIHITGEALYDLSGKERDCLSRQPLAKGDVSTLINAAILLHEHALKQKRESRWWHSPVLILVGGLIGFLPYILEKIFS